MSLMQIKRGTTASWNLGDEKVDFNDLSISTKDSVVRTYKNTIVIRLGSLSMNIPYKSEAYTKINGIPIITAEEGGALFPFDDVYTVRACARAVDGSDLTGVTWGISIYGGDEWPDESQPLLPKSYTNDDGEVSISFENEQVLSFESDTPEFFVWWDATLCDNPIDVEITLSIRECHQPSTLMPGQLGCELDENGNTLLKVGPHNVENEPTSWNNIPYVSQVLPACMYGDALPESGLPGQIFYKKVDP